MSKRIIAICQSGGEFGTNEDGSLHYSGGEAYALDLEQDTLLNDFKQELCENFQCSADGMTIKYFLPGNNKTLITISKDKDLKRMFNFFKDSDQVEVFMEARNVSNMPASRSSRTTVSEAVVPCAGPEELFSPDHDHLDYMEEDPIASSPLDPYPSGDEEKHRRASIQWENTITGVDQRFNSFPEFREALHKYSIAHGFSYKYKKNDSHRVTVKCKSEGCPWRVYASRLATTQLICIKKMNAKHTCEGTCVKAGYRATRGWVGNIIKEKLRLSPNYKPKQIALDIEREYGIQLNYSQAWRAKEIAREQLQGSYKQAYCQLPSLCEKIKETNPGSIASFSTKEDSTFHRMFVSFHASIAGFESCRPLIFLDSTLLYSKYQGTLLAATAADGNDGVFPVAFAVVDEETNDNWHWFLSELKSAVSPTSGDLRQITFVSDFQKGLKDSIQDIFGGHCYHAYCLRYLAEKLNRDLQGVFSHEARRLMVDDLYAAAFAPKLDEFNRWSDNIKAISPEAYDWVTKSEPRNWANAFFPGARYNHMQSNFGKLFNNWVSEADELPITQMVDVLRGKMMQLMYTRRNDSSKWDTTLCPLMEEKLQIEASKVQSLSLKAYASSGTTFDVHYGTISYSVDIDGGFCACKGWQLTGLPCCHVIAVLDWIGRSPYEYCSNYFTTKTYRTTYEQSINPIPNVENPAIDELDGSFITVTPPPTKRPPGRPKMKQADSQDVIKRQLQCSQCKGLGHNKKTCNKRNGIENAENTVVETPLLMDTPGGEEPEGST